MAKSKRSKAQRRAQREAAARRRRSRYQEPVIADPEKLIQQAPVSQSGLRLPTPERGVQYLAEAEDGTLVDLREDQLDDWNPMQGDEELSQEQREAEEKVLQRVLEMIFGEEEQSS